MERTEGYYNTFVVRIWCDEDEGIIRGYIQHVSSQEQTHFLSLEDMANFIKNHLAPPPIDYGVKNRRIPLAQDFGDIG